jgi:hypothetical protein
MKTLILAIFATAALIDGAVAASGTAPAFVEVLPHGALADAGRYRLDLGEPDDPNSPRAWQGPVRITGNNTRCTVSDDVAIIERPMAIMDDRLLYLTTYSGSEVRVYVVDAATCAIAWTSPSVVGTPTMTGTILTLPGHRPYSIGSKGLPQHAR